MCREYLIQQPSCGSDKGLIESPNFKLGVVRRLDTMLHEIVLLSNIQESHAVRVLVDQCSHALQATQFAQGGGHKQCGLRASLDDHGGEFSGAQEAAYCSRELRDLACDVVFADQYIVSFRDSALENRSSGAC